jgi:RNA-binding protein
MKETRFTGSGRERREIRAALHGERAVVQIGKRGIEAAVVRSAEEALVAREAIKVTFGRGLPLDAKAAANDLAERLGAEVVDVTGRTAILFRPDEPES